MASSFGGYILGLRDSTVGELLRTHGVSGVRRKWSPVQALFRVDGPRILNTEEDLPAMALPGQIGFYGLWMATLGAAILATLVYVVPSWGPPLAPTLVLSIGLFLLCLVATSFVRSSRAHNVHGDSDGLPYLPLDFVPDLGDGALALIGVAIVALLLAAVFFVIWLPFLFVLLALMSFGELWRMYRVVFVGIELVEDRRLASLGRDLLNQGAILSFGWRRFLSPAELTVADLRRTTATRVHVLFHLVGAFSLLFAISLFVERFVPYGEWWVILSIELGATAFAYVGLLLALYASHRNRSGPLLKWST